MKYLSPVKAIRVNCLECSAGQPKEVRNCALSECPLFLYRMGKNPNRQGRGRLDQSVRKTLVEQSVLSKKG